MKVDQPNLREVDHDCPWTGHLVTDQLTMRNKAVPGLVGRLCVKCGCMIYTVEAETSAIVGADGQALAVPAPKPEQPS